jgi:hypothetical protein
MNPSEDDACTLATIDLLSLANPDNGPIPPASSSADKNDVVERSAERASSETIAPRSSSATITSSPSVIYQINFDVEHVGKKKPQSKRVAIWKYGVSSLSSSTMIVSDHEARLTWSTHSGKYTISVDGEDVSSAIAKGSVLEHRWRWSHSKCRVIDKDDVECDIDDDVVSMRVVACRKPPVRSSKDFRCYEFVIGGKVFRDLPVYDVGGSRLGGGGGGAWASSMSSGMDFQNEESAYNDDSKFMSILDVIEPGWRASGFA